MNNHEILVGVSGGIAAYKAADLVSRLVQDEFQVTVVMTEAAQKFIGSATFAALSGRPVASRLFDESAFPLGAHIEIARRGSLLCVAPATADFLARAASGMADDLLSCLYLSFTGPVMVAPAMNGQMWSKPAVQRNVQQLAGDGVTVIDPADGWLSCRDRGVGRMAEVDTIRRFVVEALQRQ